MLRDGITGDWIGTFIGHKGAVWQARLSADATLAATAAADFTAKVWDTHTGEALHSLDHAHIVRAIAFPPQERPQILATGGFEKKLRIFDLSGGDSSEPTANGVTANGPKSQALSYEVGAGVHQGPIKGVVWSQDPNLLITAAEDKKIRWWDIRTQSAASEFTLDGPIGSCEYENLPLDARTSGVLSVAAGKSVYFFDGDKPGSLIKEVKTPYEVASVALNGPQRKFVTGTAGDTWVRVWDLDEEKEIGMSTVFVSKAEFATNKILELGKGHHGPVWSVAFSPDGKLYATGSEDGTIKLWKFTTGAYGLWK
jgi:serine-threonine kinase receptor-associated protein